MTDNVAILEGYTEEYMLITSCGGMAFPVLVKQNETFDNVMVTVWDTDNQEFITTSTLNCDFVRPLT